MIGRLPALNRFLSKLVDRAHPLFKVLKKSVGFVWDDECRTAFQSLKEYLMSPIILSKPEPGEDLEVYLAVSNRVVSVVLCRVDDQVRQRPVYYISHALQGPKVRYSRMEKVVFALFPAVKKLAPYFQGPMIHVLTDQSIGEVLRTSSSSGRMIKGAMMLAQLAIEFKHRPTIKRPSLSRFFSRMHDPRFRESRL